jgi:ABC-type transport system involved in multi-copper enzyme maturation permease subunit
MSMAEIVRERDTPRWGFIKRLGQNPVALKELRGRMRGGRTFILVTVYLVMLSAMLSLVYFLFVTANNSTAGPDLRQELGKAIFATVVLMEMVLVCFIAPALTSGAISLERERQTYELLRTTLLPARSLVLGKLISALFFLLLLLFAAFPLQSLASLFGGVAWEEVLISTLLLIVTAITYSTVGLFFSSFIKRTLASTVLAYAAAILIVFGIPLILLITLSMFNSFYWGGTGRFGTVPEVLLYFLGWVVVSANPIAAAIASEIMLLDQQKIFYTTLPLSNGALFPIIAPWISYTIFYLVLSLILILISIRFVKRVDK